ncbi:MAG: T9SS type A sorting domain-containing protein [Bacteroidota bacterium]
MFSTMADGNAPVDATVLNFYTAQQNSSVDVLHTVDSLISTGNYAQAASANNSVSGNLTIEQTARDYNTIWLSKFSNPDYVATSSDISDLQNIADLCIFKGGKSVAYARALLGAIFNHPFTYDDDCINNEGHERNKPNSKKQDLINNVVTIFPNPNVGSFTLSFQLKDKVQAEIVIEDISGRVIYQAKLSTQTNSMLLNLNDARNGVYFVKVMNGNETISVNKVIINH